MFSIMPAAFRMRLLRSLSQLVGWFFGTFWALLAAFALPRPYDRVGCALAAVVALVFFARIWRDDSFPDAARPIFRMPVYLIAVAMELLGMYTAALLLLKFGAKEQVYPVIGCIVGLHFIGLWLATRSRRFLNITVGMCAVSLFSMVMPFTWHTLGLRYFLLGSGNAIILWVAAGRSE